MPIYEYQCAACHHEMEALRKISDPVLVDCPSCQQPTLKKKISAAAFRLKGGGWYETDFKTGGKKNIAGDASKSASAADSSGSSSAGSSGSGDSAGKTSSDKKSSDAAKSSSTTGSAN